KRDWSSDVCSSDLTVRTRWNSRDQHRKDRRCPASPTGYYFDLFDADRVSSTAFEQSSRRAYIFTCIWQQATAFVAIRKLSREGHVQLSRLCEDCQGRSRPHTLDYAFSALCVFGH